MALKLPVPIISITSEAEEDDDHQYINNEVLTDVEDIYVGDKTERQGNKRRKHKSTFILHQSEDIGMITDVEDIESSDLELEPEVVDSKFVTAAYHNNVVQEIYNVKTKGKNGKKLNTQTSITKINNSINNLCISNNDNFLTDVEDVYSSDNELCCDDNLPDIEIPSECMNYCGDVKIHDSAVFGESDDESSANTIKNNLCVIQKNKATLLTDVEVISDSELETKKKKKKTRKRRPKGTLRNKGGVTDIEDVGLSADEAKQYTPRTVVSEINQIFARSKSLMQFPDTDSDDEIQVKQRKSSAQFLPVESKEDGLTDLDDMILSDVDCDYNYDESILNKQLINMEDSYVDEKRDDRGNESDSDGDIYLKVDQIDLHRCSISTDLESIFADANDVSSRSKITDTECTTEEETFSDDEFNFILPRLPDPVREIIFIKENKSGQPIVIVSPMDECKAFIDKIEENVTDDESFSDHDEYLDVELIRRGPTPDVLICESDIIESKDALGYELIPDVGNFESVTDTEDLIMDNKKKRRNKLIKRQAPVVHDDQFVKTDVEELYPSGPEVAPTNLLMVDTSGSVTDVENLDVSDENEEINERPPSSTPDCLQMIGGEIVFLQEHDYASKASYLNINATPRRFHEIVTPEPTDLEEIIGSNDEDDFYSFTNKSSSDMEKEFNDYSSKVTSCNTRKANLDAPEEVIYIKGGVIQENHTDVEDVDFDLDLKSGNCFVFHMKLDGEWEASGRKGRSPDEPIQAQQSVDEDVEKQGEASVSWQHQETSTSTKKAEKDEASASTPEHSEQVTDQHQLSEEMKALLKEMEKESKK